MSSLINSLLVPILFVYVLVFIILFGQRYLRSYSRNKLLKFTQEEVKEKRKEIDDLIYGRKLNLSNDSSIPITRVFALYNELAVGINEGIYDERYVRMVLGYEMVDFYKAYYKYIVTQSDTDIVSGRFMPLELLLKKWDDDGPPSYRINRHARYF